MKCRVYFRVCDSFGLCYADTSNTEFYLLPQNTLYMFSCYKLKDGLVPVSYTHLDVYKRQRSGSSNLFKQSDGWIIFQCSSIFLLQ